MDSDAIEDGQLLIRVARGDRTSLAALYERHAGIMTAVAERMLRDRREAEDVLHDVFVEIWRCAGDYDPSICSVRGWFLMRLRSRCLDRLRAAKRRRGHMQQIRLQSDPAPPEKEASDGFRVRGAIAGLTHDQQHVLTLAYFAGLSANEIANRLHIPVGTVKSRLGAALRGLRQALADVRAEQVNP